MRTLLPFATATLVLCLGTSALADAVRDQGPSADELLDIWNRDYSAEAPAMLTPERFDSQYTQSEYDLRSYSAPATPSYTRPDGRSLTPNIDHLLSKSNNPSPGVNCDPYRQRHRRRHPPGGPPSNDPPGCPGGGGHDDHGGGGCEPVPEPGTLLLFGAAAGIAGLRKRFARKSGR